MLHTGGFMWTPTDEFVLLEDKDKEMHRAVAREDYEFAAKLRDL
jgi:protein-arginine kinase activator protein McsA